MEETFSWLRNPFSKSKLHASKNLWASAVASMSAGSGSWCMCEYSSINTCSCCKYIKYIYEKHNWAKPAWFWLVTRSALSRNLTKCVSPSDKEPCEFAAARLGLVTSYTFPWLCPTQKYWSQGCAEIIWYHYFLTKAEHLSYFSAVKNNHNKLSSTITVYNYVILYLMRRTYHPKNELWWTNGISEPRLHFRSIGGHII